MDRRARWHLAQDIGLAGLIAGLGLAEVWVPFESLAGDGSPVASTIGILICAVAISLRRILPIGLVAVPLAWIAAALVEGGGIQVLFFGQFVPFLVSLYSIARHGRRREIGIVVGVSAAMLMLGDLFVPALAEGTEILFHWGVSIVVLAAGLGLRASETRAVGAAVRAAEVEAGAQTQALQAIADERARIARELHDILGHSVSVMVVQAGAAERALEDDPDFVRSALRVIRETGSASLDEVRRVVALLRDDTLGSLSPQPTLSDLDALVATVRSMGLAVTLRCDVPVAVLSPALEVTVYRIVQEALTNVQRHSRATEVDVFIECAGDDVIVAVRDNGSPRAPQDPASVRPSGTGLIGMRERIAIFGGRLDVDRSDAGFAVVATLPVTANAGAPT